MGGPFEILVAFGAGFLSFVSPCVLPLVPGYLSFVSGAAVSAAEPGREARRALGAAVFFVLGFSVVFVALGASASLLGSLLAGARAVLTRLAGVVIFLLGFLMLGVVKAPWLYREARIDVGRTRGFGRWTGFVAGAAFGFGWTPCVGPILAAILMLAGRTGDVGRGVALLTAYSAGLGVPFLLAAVLVGRVSAFEWLKRRSAWIDRIAGAIMMLLGLAIAAGVLERLVALMARVLPGFGGV